MGFRIRKVFLALLIIQSVFIFIHMLLYVQVEEDIGLPMKELKPGTSNITRRNKITHLTVEKNITQIKMKLNRRQNDTNVLYRSINESKVMNATINSSKPVNMKVHNDEIHTVKRLRRPVEILRWKCENLEFPDISDGNDRWQEVDGTTAFVFSAFFVDRGRKVVIVGARTLERQVYFCLIWRNMDGNMVAEQVGASVRQLPEGHKLRFNAMLFECSSGTGNDIPLYVSLVVKRCESPNNLLKVHLTTKPEQYQRRFTVCLTPLHSNYDKAYELIEWIELNRILGAQKFMIYNYTSSNNIVEVLQHYRRQGLVEVIQWRLPVETGTLNDTRHPEIHYYGQTIALQDCLFRNKLESEFIVNIDLDEFIIPRGNITNNWGDIIRQMDNSSGAYIVRNTFFRKEWDSVYLNEQKNVDRYGLTTLKKLYREETIFKVKKRSKYFARTDVARQVMIHFVLYLPSVNIAQTVPTEIALLHHYRDWENEFKLPNDKIYDDTVPRKFGTTLLQNVARVWSKMTNIKMNVPAI